MSRRLAGRAELLRLRMLQGRAGLAAGAELLGFIRGTEPEASEGQEQPSPEGAQVAQLVVQGPSAEGWPRERLPARYWRLVAEEALPQRAIAPEPAEGLWPSDGAEGGSLLAVPPASSPCPWPQLEPRLRAAWTQGGRGPIDEEALSRRIARGLPLGSLPRRLRRVWPSRIQLWLDMRPELWPLHSGQLELWSRLRRLCRPDQLQVRRLRGGPLPPPPGPGEVLLVVGDLGLLDGKPGPWEELARACLRGGLQPVALLPCAVEGLPPSLTRGFRLLSWEARPPSRDEAERAVEPLLRLCAAGRLIQPGLLRSLRAGLPGAGLWTELRLLERPEILGDAAGLVVKEREAPLLLEQLLKGLSEAAQAQLAAQLQRWHGGCPAELGHAEVLCWQQAGATHLPGELGKARAFLSRLASSLERGEGRSTWASFARSLSSSLPDQAYEGEDALLLRRLFKGAWQGARPPHLPPGLALEEGPSRELELRQLGGRLVLLPPGPDPAAPTAPPRPGSPLGRLEVGALLGVEGRGPIPAEQGLELPLEGGLGLLGRRRRLRLQAWEKEGWASRAGRDQFGLWAEASFEGAAQRMRWIPPGTFLMGSPGDEEGRWSFEGPQHEVTIARGYWMGEVPVTQALYEAVMGQNPSHFRGKPQLPVEGVSWHDCLQLCQRLGPGWRLPTEAEWEYACRAGTSGRSYAPGVPLEELGWYGDNSKGSTQPVRQKRANAWGLHDMLGNVREWCLDPSAPYAAHARTDAPRLRTDTGVLRVYRGGSWTDGAQVVRPACRFVGGPGRRWQHLGFRLVRGLAPGLEVAERGEEGGRLAAPARGGAGLGLRAERGAE